MSKYLVVGGGISGLATAYYLSQSTTSAKIYLLETSSRLGGWLESSRTEQGAIFDHGPRSLRATGNPGRNSLLLADQLQLSADILHVPATHPAAQNRYIYVNQTLHQLPKGLMGIIKKQSPFTRSLLRQCWKEPFVKTSAQKDDSVYNFFSRRLSPEVAEYLIDPLCRGIYAGDCRTLSIHGCFKALFDWEQKYGSFVVGAIRDRPDPDQSLNSPLIEQAKREKWRLWTFSGGLQQLADSLKQTLQQSSNVEVCMGETCTQIDIHSSAKAKVKTSSRELDVDHLFACLPAQDLARIITSGESSIASNLGSINSANVAVVNLEYLKAPDQLLPVQGFGHLVPSCEPSQLLGIVYESCVFPQHDRPDKPSTRLSCMMGGSWFSELFGEPDKVDVRSLEETAMKGVYQQLGIKDSPSFCQVNIQRNCIPQYAVGHNQLMRGIEETILTRKSPISLLGASYKGASVNDCIYNAKQEVVKVLGRSDNFAVNRA